MSNAPNSSNNPNTSSASQSSQVPQRPSHGRVTIKLPATKLLQPQVGADTNTRWLVIGGVIGAIITGLCAIAAEFVPPDFFNSPPKPVPLATHIAQSPAETVLMDYLAAMKSGDFEHAAELVSDYSLKILPGEDRGSAAANYREAAKTEAILLDYEIIEVIPLIDGVSTRIRAVNEHRSIDTGEVSRSKVVYTVHKDIDGIWRVNVLPIVDYQYTHQDTIISESGEISVTPILVVRSENKMSIFLKILTNGEFFSNDNSVFCTFQDGNVSGQVSRGTIDGDYALFINGFQESYPTRCILPEMHTQNGQNAWTPTFDFQYK